MENINYFFLLFGVFARDFFRAFPVCVEGKLEDSAILSENGMDDVLASLHPLVIARNLP